MFNSSFIYSELTGLKNNSFIFGTYKLTFIIVIFTVFHATCND